MLHEKPVGNGVEMLRKVENIADQLIDIQLDTGRFPDICLQIAKEFNMKYSKFARHFLSTQGISIISLFEMRRIEKVKELLVYSEQSLAQIAKKLGYRNRASLAYILKKKTGRTASYFKQIRQDKLIIIRKYNREQNKQ